MTMRGISTLFSPASILFAADTMAWSAVSAIGGAALVFVVQWLNNRASQTRSFDQRLRLEKEYQVYTGLFERLFQLRGVLGNLLSDEFTEPHSPHENVLEAFNGYRAAVRHGEPFIHTAVLTPAREIDAIAGEILFNEDRARRSQRQKENASRFITPELREQLVTQQIQINEESEQSFKSIDELFEKVSREIRARVGPP
jgi:hypothetical protein